MIKHYQTGSLYMLNPTEICNGIAALFSMLNETCTDIKFGCYLNQLSLNIFVSMDKKYTNPTIMIKQNIFPNVDLLQDDFGYFINYNYETIYSWDHEMLIDPDFEIEDDDILEEQFEEFMTFIKCVERVEKEFILDVETGYQFYNTLLQSGFNPEIHGYRIMCYFVHKIAEAIKEFKKCG